MNLPARRIRVRIQKKNFDANWINRGFVPGAVLVMTPKFALLLVQQVVLGGAN